LADTAESAGRLHDAERSEREEVSPSLAGLGQHLLRIPTKPATNSNRKPATDSDLKPAGIPI